MPGIYQGSWTGGGAGAGGSVAITAGTLTGTGSVSADGGAGATTAGAGGGGGRVAIRYGSLGTFTMSSATASGGTKNGAATSGTAGSGFSLDRVVDDGAGTMDIFSGFDFPSDGDYTRDVITVREGAAMACSAATTTALTISSAAWLSLSSVSWNCPTGYESVSIYSSAGLSTTSTSLTFGGATSVSIGAPVWTNVTTTFGNIKGGAMGSMSVSSSAWTLTGFVYNGAAHAGFSSTGGGVLSIPGALSLTLVSSTISSSVSSTSLTGLSLDARSIISATGRGCAGSLREWGGGYGPSWSTDVCIYRGRGVGSLGSSLDGGAGATHGGVGGSYGSSGVATSTTYGSSTLPTLFGAGGGGGWGAAALGGDGGGIINIVVSGSLYLDGVIGADGATGTYGGAWGGGGGGAGGSVNIQTSTLTGAGFITARGGGGVSSSGSGGGGGRVAIRYSSLGTFSLSNLIVSGGLKSGSGNSGSTGTTYTLLMNQTPSDPTSLGPTALVNGSTTGSTTPTFTFTLADADVSDTVKFQIQVDDSSGFASPVVDYTSALEVQGGFSFQVGQAVGSGSYTTGSSGQTLSSGSYYWRVKTIDANAAESAYTTANSGAVAFIVDSATRTISFSTSTSSELESITATSIRIVLDTTHFEDVTVNYAATDGTADGSGSDYTLASGTATITAGDTSTTIALVVVNDAINEPDETIVVTLSSPVYASIGSTSTHTYTVTDNDTSGITFSKLTASVTEGGATDTYTVVLDSEPTSTVRLAFSTSTLGVTLSTSTVDFTSSNWSTPISVTVTATNDDVDEMSSHTSLVTSLVTVPTGYAYGYDAITLSDLTATITDNDTAGVTLSKTALSVMETGIQDTYTLVLTSAPTSTVTVSLSTSASDITTNPPTVSFTSFDWNVPQVITVGAVNDSDVEGNHTRRVVHALLVSDYAYGYSEGFLIDAVLAAITDNDVGGAGAVAATVPFIPLPPSPEPLPVTPPMVNPSLPPEQNPQPARSDIVKLVEQDQKEFRVKITPEQARLFVQFIAEGTETTAYMNERERRALVRDALDTMGEKATIADLDSMTKGLIPSTRNIVREREQLSRVRTTFRTIYGRDPNFKKNEENLAWNTMMYRLRFVRDLSQEQKGVGAFRSFFGRLPQDPFQWAVVRMLGYIR